MEVFILIGLIILNGAFAMSEIALVTARKGRLMKQASDGDRAAEIALELGEDPTRFLSTVQIGITSIGILNGIFGEAVLAEPLSLWMQTLGAEEHLAGISSTVIVVVVVTYLSIVIGELVPKRLGQIHPEAIALIVARPMQILALITRPFVHLLALSTNGLMHLFRIRDTDNPNMIEDEITALLDESTETDAIEQRQHAMVRNVFRLDDRKVSSLMIPRADIVYIDTSLPAEENLERITSSNHSRFPVCHGGLQTLLGVIHTKQILTYTLKGEAADLTSNLSPCVFVPESLTGMELLENFRVNHAQMAFVVNEYGDVEGMLTLQDVLEAVTGEFSSQDIDDAWAVQREDGSWLLDGIIPLPELKDRLKIKAFPEEDKANYHTLSGMLMLLLERLPKAGDYVDWESWRLEIVDMDDRRIDKVLAYARRLPDDG